MIFKAIRSDRPYPPHGLENAADWASLAPRAIRLEELITTRSELDLQHLLSEDSTFYGDIFCHVVEYGGQLYLEDGLHRALRAALQQRPVVYARVLSLD